LLVYEEIALSGVYILALSGVYIIAMLLLQDLIQSVIRFMTLGAIGGIKMIDLVKLCGTSEIVGRFTYLTMPDS